MKKKLKYFWVSILSLFVVLSFSGCELFSTETVYDFWIITDNYSELVEEDEEKWSSLKDGYYYTNEITEAQFESLNLSKSLSVYKPMTEDQFISYLISLDFGSTEARNAADWFLNIDHGLLTTLNGSLVYFIVK